MTSNYSHLPQDVRDAAERNADKLRYTGPLRVTRSDMDTILRHLAQRPVMPKKTCREHGTMPRAAGILHWGNWPVYRTRLCLHVS